jgi:hypothetical protein
MGFGSGSVSFRRFAVIGKSKDMPKVADQSLLDKLTEHALKPGEFGGTEEVEYGWSGGRHIFDGQFSFDTNVFNDALCFALRIDTNKVPGEMKKAFEIMEEEAVAKANPSGFISKSQKKAVKEVVREKMEDEMKGGKYRRSKLVSILWDVAERIVYSTASGANLEKLMEIFERTFGLELEPITSGSLALKLLEAKGKKRDYEDLRPTRFAHGPDGESQHPEYPWVAKGPQPKDFLGNEFLVWLWHEADARTSIVSAEGVGEVTIFLDRALDLDCAYGQTGKDTFRGDGPSRSPEARDALRVGKVPRKAGLILHAAEQFELMLAAEGLAVGAAKLPDVEDADSPRALFEERITLLRDLCKMLDGLFAAFLKVRASASWEGHTGALRRWIAQTAKPVAAVA